ncbi:MAG: NAD(P)H azoreductase [Chroococcidiopsis cubana SAG 39.79]|uniref:Epimerase n=1 Tax=Chroococcidiopsis cubana SAG 39.79 TaxID=388085 RepID=A0AB37UQM9_9CYAN|nr:SDR family oxidoreductase [Chroococcidiopsis cubana]MDZ4873751.1 NAD(P)H azoreductase [Chroococcidiopsis cubana SAG 39.79]PSB65810.1 NAD(P)-dependent oxidoreductase [Chroococcidiopsis cubana CCALA 043]RUT13574.1 epimerase [Chroococcidiopsis cubana SAG 39.79]
MTAALILVAGATGGVGQLAVAKALEKGFTVRVLTRQADKAKQMFGDRVEIAVGDIRQPNTLPAAVQNVTHIICCTGTTAFPSAKWDFQNFFSAQNSPQQVDAVGVKNLVAAAPQDLQRFVFVSSCGVLRKKQFPFSILNAFGVLDAKQEGEQAIATSGLPYTIIRPGRLIDGPYTSYDLNTLLKATTDGKLAVVVGTGDTLVGDTSRIDVATACVECISDPVTVNKTFEIVNSGARPEITDWEALFAQLN